MGFNTLTNKMIKLRLDRNLNQRQFAKKMKIEESYLSLIERGRAPVTVDYLNRFLNIFARNAEERAKICEQLKIKNPTGNPAEKPAEKPWWDKR